MTFSAGRVRYTSLSFAAWHASFAVSLSWQPAIPMMSGLILKMSFSFFAKFVVPVSLREKTV